MDAKSERRMLCLRIKQLYRAIACGASSQQIGEMAFKDLDFPITSSYEERWFVRHFQDKVRDLYRKRRGVE